MAATGSPSVDSSLLQIIYSDFLNQAKKEGPEKAHLGAIKRIRRLSSEIWESAEGIRIRGLIHLQAGRNSHYPKFSSEKLAVARRLGENLLVLSPTSQVGQMLLTSNSRLNVSKS